VGETTYPLACAHARTIGSGARPSPTDDQ
jgi:hypothetical protein